MTNFKRYNTIFRGQQLQYPLTDLTFKWLDCYDGNDLVNEIGINIPWVSGTGLDAIYDFSVLSDLRLNKNAYLGNSFSLPEYYDFPYSASIYFDTNNPYHWKLPDFHYANFLEQSLTVDNIAFLKASATTNTSNIIDEVNSLLIYSTAQSGGDLNRLKSYIGIQPDFYGSELQLDGDMENALVTINNEPTICVRSFKSQSSDYFYTETKSYKLTDDNLTIGTKYCYWTLNDLNLELGKEYLVEEYLYIPITNQVYNNVYLGINPGGIIQATTEKGKWVKLSGLFKYSSQLFLYPMYSNTTGLSSESIYMDAFIIKPFYSNYYNQ